MRRCDVSDPFGDRPGHQGPGGPGRWIVCLAITGLTAALIGACRGAAPPAVPVADALPEVVAELVAEEEGFSGTRAWAHLEQLVAFGPRPAQSEAAARTRAWIRAELVRVGAQLEERVTPIGDPTEAGRGLVHVLARLPGQSQDAILLATPYSSPSKVGLEISGANEGGSGVAVLVEVARLLAESPRNYTVYFAFIEGDGDAPQAGSRALAALLAREGFFDSVRASFFVERIGDADLRIARDLYSTRNDREEVWRVARELGHGDSFTQNEYESPLGAHRAFFEAGLRRGVALIDTSYGGTEPPGVWYRSEGDTLEHCARESLDAVGEVIVASLERIEARLAKIDRFALAPAQATVDEARRRASALQALESPAAAAPIAGADAADTASAAETAGAVDTAGAADTAAAADAVDPVDAAGAVETSADTADAVSQTAAGDSSDANSQAAPTAGPGGEAASGDRAADRAAEPAGRPASAPPRDPPPDPGAPAGVPE